MGIIKEKMLGTVIFLKNYFRLVLVQNVLILAVNGTIKTVTQEIMPPKTSKFFVESVTCSQTDGWRDYMRNYEVRKNNLYFCLDCTSLITLDRTGRCEVCGSDAVVHEHHQRLETPAEDKLMALLEALWRS